MRHPDSGPPATFRERPHRSALTSARRARPTNMQDGGSEKTSSCGHSQNPWPLTKSMPDAGRNGQRPIIVYAPRGRVFTMNRDKLNTGQKALQINLDAKKYGTFAEIGAGQEVARWFFHVGKASGTVAKTISAYDMAVSDAIYGKADRYVSRKRLQSMLDYEFKLLLERLNTTRGDKCTFF